MTREQKIARARELRQQGWKLREIGDELGAAPKTVHHWLSDPDGSKLRARKDSYRGTCEKCGAHTDGSNGRAKAPTRCNDCAQAEWHAKQTAARERREEEIAGLYRQGLASWQIAERLGLTPPVVSSIAYRARQHGLDVPYAPTGGTVHRSKVAA